MVILSNKKLEWTEKLDSDFIHFHLADKIIKSPLKKENTSKKNNNTLEQK